MSNKEENQNKNAKTESTQNRNNQCFVIMPISDPKEYESGHFKCVYEDIFKPAIEDAGFTPKRADDDNSSSMIQVSIIKDIVESPMAICDLSTRNPNVLFELGVRQAFDLPVVLVQENDTPRIFDISTINTIDYRKALTYREVIEDRKKITNAIKETKDNTKGVNSIVRLLGIESAKKKDSMDENTILYSMSNQLMSIMNRLDIIETNRSEKSQSVNLTKKKELTVDEESLEANFSFIVYRYNHTDNINDCRDLIKQIDKAIYNYKSAKYIRENYRYERITSLMEMQVKLNEKIKFYERMGQDS